MKNYKKFSFVFLLIGSLFFTGCDASKITNVITNITEGIQKAIPAIKSVFEAFKDTTQNTAATASDTVQVTTTANTAPTETNINTNSGAVIPTAGDIEDLSKPGDNMQRAANSGWKLDTSLPIKGQIEALDIEIAKVEDELKRSNSNDPNINSIKTIISQLKDRKGVLEKILEEDNPNKDSINASNATVETTKSVIENLDRSLKAQEDYLKTHPGNKVVTEGIAKLKAEIKRRKQILLELQASENSNTEDSHETKYNTDLSQSVNCLLSSNNQNIRGLKTAIKEMQEKIAKYPNHKEEYLETINLFKNRIREIEEENKQVTSTNIAVMGVVTERTLKKYKAILESDARTHEEKIDATKQVIACFYYGISLYKDNLKNHPNNKDVMAKYDYFKSEMIKYKTILSKLQASD